MSELTGNRLRGIGWLSSFVVTGLVASGLAMNQIEELVNDLVGGLWDELRTDFLGFITSYTWGTTTFIELLFNVLFLFLIVLVPFLLFRKFLKKNKDYKFYLSKKWINWCKGLLGVSAASLALYLFSVWQVSIAFQSGKALSLSALQWELISLAFSLLWIACLFVGIFLVSAIETPPNSEKVGVRAFTYWFAVLSVLIFVIGRAFSPSPETEDALLQEFDFMRSSAETVDYATVCSNWIILRDSYGSLNLDSDPLAVTDQRIQTNSVLGLILLENLYFMQLRDPSWSELYTLRGLSHAFTNQDDVVKVLPQGEAMKFLNEAEKFSLEEGSDLFLPFMRGMDERCPAPPAGSLDTGTK
jgi:hypothetical protein